MVTRSFFTFSELGIIHRRGKLLASVLLNFEIKLEISNFYVYLTMTENHSGLWTILIVTMATTDMNELDCQSNSPGLTSCAVYTWAMSSTCVTYHVQIKPGLYHLC